MGLGKNKQEEMQLLFASTHVPCVYSWGGAAFGLQLDVFTEGQPPPPPLQPVPSSVCLNSPAFIYSHMSHSHPQPRHGGRMLVRLDWVGRLMVVTSPWVNWWKCVNQHNTTLWILWYPISCALHEGEVRKYTLTLLKGVCVLESDENVSPCDIRLINLSGSIPNYLNRWNKTVDN